MLPVQFILLILVVSVPSALSGATWAAMPAWAVAGSYLMSQGALVLWVWSRSIRSVRMLSDPTVSTGWVSGRSESLLTRARWVSLVLVGMHLATTPLSGMVYEWIDGWFTWAL